MILSRLLQENPGRAHFLVADTALDFAAKHWEEAGVWDVVGVYKRAFPGADENFSTYHSKGSFL